jgi:ABC-type antimicrobial peptide transport system permease subunit
MLKNYFTIAFRNFRKNPVFSGINILGLSIGISASLVIYLIVNYDFSFDKFHKDSNRIYRVVTAMSFAGEPFNNSGVPMPLQVAMKSEITGVEIAAPFHGYYEPKVAIEKANSSSPTIFKKQKDIIFADSGYFKLIAYKWLAGSATTSLNEPFKVVLTESRAKKYFPDASYSQMLGKTIIYDDSINITVSGVVKDLDEITDFVFKEFLSFNTIEKSNLKNETSWGQWGSISSATQLVIKLAEHTKPANIEKQMAALRVKHDDKNGKSTTTHRLQALNDIHFNPDFDNFDQRLAHKPTLYSLIVLGIFLLVLGCINFINLTTAQASQRAKEIGIRKTLGSVRKQLIFQFLGETFFLTLIATLVSFAITPLILKLFSDFIPEGLKFSPFKQPGILIFLVSLLLIVSALSGLYPALVLSGFRPVLVLKNQAYANTGKTRSAWLRKTLTVSQFVIAQVFVIGTFIVSSQIHYALNKDLGFTKNAIIFFNGSFRDKNLQTRAVLAEKLRSLPGVKMVSIANSPPSSGNTWSTSMSYNDGKKDIDFDIQLKYGDSFYLKLYQLQLIAGRNIQNSDTMKELVINETMLRLMGLKNPYDAVGKMILRDKKPVPVVGVMKDFHQKSLHEAIKPLSLTSAANNTRSFNIALTSVNGSTDGWKNTIKRIEAEFKKIYPEEDFEYKFFDESIATFYKADQNISKLLNWAAGLAILISCLGLLGLVIYTTNQRTKEIGVRKVLGASITQVVTLLSKDFVKLVLIAFVIASPIAWWAMQKWLQNFEYRVSVTWWIFAVSGLVMFGVAIITLSIQTIRSASANPVKSLRSE